MVMSSLLGDLKIQVETLPDIEHLISSLKSYGDQKLVELLRELGITSNNADVLSAYAGALEKVPSLFKIMLYL